MNLFQKAAVAIFFGVAAVSPVGYGLAKNSAAHAPYDVGLTFAPTAPDSGYMVGAVIGDPDSAVYKVGASIRHACVPVTQAQADTGVGIAAVWGMPGGASNQVLVLWYPDAAHRHLDLIADANGLHVYRFRTAPCQ